MAWDGVGWDVGAQGAWIGVGVGVGVDLLVGGCGLVM